MSKQSFADLGVSRAVTSSLCRSMGSPSRSRSSVSVIGDVIAGRDVIAKSPTGSGKTLAFGIPLVERIGRRRSSARRARARADARARDADRRRHPRDRARASAARHGRLRRRRPAQAGQGRRPLARARRDARPARGSARPWRLHARRDPDPGPRRGRPDARHGLSPGGRPHRRALPARRARRCSSPPRSTARPGGSPGDTPATPRCTSTARPNGAPRRRSSTGSSTVAQEHRVQALVAELRRERDLTLVFVRTKHGADRLVKRLRSHGIEAVAMHGNKSQRQRERALARFESGAIDTLVATDVAARGIDVTGISHVINFDPPADSETYVHRVGRTGRAGAKGVGVTLVAPDEHHDMERLVARLGLRHGLAGGPRSRHQSPVSANPGAARGARSARKHSRAAARRGR